MSGCKKHKFSGHQLLFQTKKMALIVLKELKRIVEEPKYMKLEIMEQMILKKSELRARE